MQSGIQRGIVKWYNAWPGTTRWRFDSVYPDRAAIAIKVVVHPTRQGSPIEALGRASVIAHRIDTDARCPATSRTAWCETALVRLSTRFDSEVRLHTPL